MSKKVEPDDYEAMAMALPEGIDFEEYVIATYYGEINANMGVSLKVAQAIAIEQSTGTWVAVPGETPEVRKRHVAKVISISQLPDYEFERPSPKQEPYRKYVLQVGFPAENVWNQIPILLTAIFGNISMGGRLKMIDVRFPKKWLAEFKGPKFGIEGIRKLLKIPDRPLLNNMIKPCVYDSLEMGRELFYEAAVGGCDVIKDDELLANQAFNPIRERIPAYMEMVDRAKSEKGEDTLFTVNITDKMPDMLENADKAMEWGANALMVNYPVVGFSTLRAICEDPSIKVPVLGHMDFAGTMYMAPQYGVSSHLILAKLPRIAGADILVHPAPYGKATVLHDKFERVAHTMRMPMYNIKPMFPMPSGGITVGMVDKCINALGPDIVIGSGGGIHAHPDGPISGAKAFRQAIDAVMQGIKIKDHAKDHKELGVALGTWGTGKIEMGKKY
ncbi:MAG: ribulose 1,5-bisphosphate carboxylase [Candidatus Helarchaeota archaeon]|nr:ribulose 1,5-bisphosphate carboxylase [Candidatus Helarchaeota archaeon]